MELRDEIKKITDSISAELREKSSVFMFEKTIAERKAFLSKKKLVYSARLVLDDKEKSLTFSEALKETGFGLSAGGDSDMSSGFGFKSETYKTGTGPREGTLEEQSNLFGKKYNYSFDFSKIRGKFEILAAQAGYGFRYKIF